MGETNGPLSLADDREVETICRRFDIDLRAGRQPRLEDALADCREDLQQVVLRELLLTEIEFRLEINSLHADSLKQRFPDHVDLIDELLAEVTAGAETAPARIGRYDIVQEIGRGGMGRVFLANDTALHRQVALKIPRFEDPCFKGSAAPRSIERFYREARLMAGLRHKNLCPVYDVGQAGDTHYLTMAYIPGVSLAERFEHGVPWPVDKAVAVVERASRGLAVAHRAGVVHRDLKPSNIIFDNDGEPVVTDFGLARSAVDSSEWSHPELRIGTPKYMSPEQIDSPWTVGPATDVYALGVLLYQLITGRMPFESTSAVRVMLQIVSASSVPPLSRHVPEIDPRLEAICLKAMARDPADRYPNAGELADALAGWQRSYAAQTAALPQRRRSRTAALLAVLLLTAVAASVILIRPWNDERRQAWRIDRRGLPDNGTAPMPSRRSPQAGPEKLPPLATTGWTVDHERTTKIASAVGGGPALADYYRFGDAIASLGDLDGDGNHDFAVGAWRDQTGGPGRGAVHVLFMNDDGTARQVCSITGASTGGPELADFERFGCSLTAVGDLDGDGVTELAVGAQGSEDNSELRGSVYVLFLNRDATLKKTVQISSDIGGGPPLSAFDTFGAAVAVIDFADDRFPKLAVGCTGDDTGFGDAGAVYLLALDSDGTCANWRKIAAGDAGLPLAEADRFGSAITAVGDLDGDGIEEMVVGAPGDDTGGPDRGAVYLLFPKADGNIARFQKITCGTVVERNSFRSESTETGFSLSDGAGFGSALAAVTSRADDTVDLAIGAPFEHDSGDQRGAVFLLSIRADGSMSRAAKIGSGTPGAPSLRDFDNFGSAVARQGTATGGAIHLLIGASGDDTGGSDRGAVYSLFAMPETDQP